MSVFSFPAGVDPSVMLRYSQQQSSDTTPQPAQQSEPQSSTAKLRMKRARSADGHFRADNPSTPENEAWEQASNEQTGKT